MGDGGKASITKISNIPGLIYCKRFAAWQRQEICRNRQKSKEIEHAACRECAGIVRSKKKANGGVCIDCGGKTGQKRNKRCRACYMKSLRASRMSGNGSRF